jgi:hypothetical protein
MTRVLAVLCLAFASLPAIPAVPTITAAVAIRNGALVIPLDPAANTSIDSVRLSNGQRPQAYVRWLTASLRPVRDWGLPPRELTVSREPTPEGEPFLLVRLPEDGNGDLRVDDSVIRLHWFDMPASMPMLRLNASAAPAAVRTGYASPPLGDPLQAWRCELLAAMRGSEPPSLTRFGDAERVLAVSSIGSWRVALHRIAAADISVARQVAELLTGVAGKKDEQIAAWLTATSPMQELLKLAMNDHNPALLAERVLRWCDRQTELLAWVVSDQGRNITLSFANPRPTEMLAEVTWAQPGELPWGTRIPSHTAQQTSYEALPLRAAANLLVQVGQNHLVLPIDRSVRVVEPPGLTVGPLYPTRTLSDVRAGTPPPPPATSLQTFAQVRRLMGQWEIMLECRWGGKLPREQVGMDTVDILWQCGGESHEVTVSPLGIASASPATAYISQHDHAWLCRVVLPNAWICDSPSLALRRTHGDTGSMDTWPTPGTPWKCVPDPVMLDLAQWDGQEGVAASP